MQPSAADVFVLVLDPAALDSSAYKLEYGYAADLGKSILPVLVSDGVPTNLLPPARSRAAVALPPRTGTALSVLA